ncbi:unnamed protein product [Didymodactylos carnosus]|uniref:Large ribosomal subunit protein eL24 n=1 Tax=Didymodactylos carnosus TaxID=1234261 RepID=A0A814FDA1_9BILA|nr:unnamed protein product [Didymodactylos carnosus]CAF0979121.1 unnamed protein product [Didymodactylos carnosus]CAF3648514.1 unnamed protein product [Didymodactylos carnosus]CAF3751817.1 unnamed protein product [Didymodactylos carnosus]
MSNGKKCYWNWDLLGIKNFHSRRSNGKIRIKFDLSCNDTQAVKQQSTDQKFNDHIRQKTAQRQIKSSRKASEIRIPWGKIDVPNSCFQSKTQSLVPISSTKTGKVHIYLNSKCQRSADMKRNPRRITWTVYYRRKHKKGQAEQEIKKRTRRTTKFQRAITGVTWNEILAKRNQQPEFRKAQRQDAINAAKQAKKAKAQQKKTTTPSVKAGRPVKKVEKIQKNIPKGGPKKGTQR